MDRIVDQVVDRNIYSTYMPQIQLLVKETLDIKDEAEGILKIYMFCCYVLVLFVTAVIPSAMLTRTPVRK